MYLKELIKLLKFSANIFFFSVRVLAYVFFLGGIHHFHKILKGFSHSMKAEEQGDNFFFFYNFIKDMKHVFSTFYLFILVT